MPTSGLTTCRSTSQGITDRFAFLPNCHPSSGRSFTMATDLDRAETLVHTRRRKSQNHDKTSSTKRHVSVPAPWSISASRAWFRQSTNSGMPDVIQFLAHESTFRIHYPSHPRWMSCRPEGRISKPYETRPLWVKRLGSVPFPDHQSVRKSPNRAPGMVNARSLLIPPAASQGWTFGFPEFQFSCRRRSVLLQPMPGEWPPHFSGARSARI